MAEYNYQFNAQRTFGVEIECVINEGTTRIQVLSAIRSAGFSVSDANSYTHQDSTNRRWVMKVDGTITDRNGASLRGYDRNLEIVSPVLSGMGGIAELVAVVDILKAMCSVNRSCGLHVHHGVPELSSKQFKVLYCLYRTNQKVFDMLTTPSRRVANGQAPFNKRLSMADNELPTVGDANRGASHIAMHDGRYRVVNFDSYLRRGTVEFRQHHSSLDSSKIVAWVVLTQACVEFTLNAEGRRILDYSTLNSFTPINGLCWRVGIARTGDSFEAAQFYRLRKAYNLQQRRLAAASVEAPAALAEDYEEEGI